MKRHLQGGASRWKQDGCISLCAADCIGDCRCWPCRSACWTGGREATGTDGAYFWCTAGLPAAADAEDVLLHSVLHAMLGHPWTRDGVTQRAGIWRATWRRSFCVSGCWTGRSKGCTRRRFMPAVTARPFGAERLCASEGEFPIPQDELREAFRRDSHEYWAAAQRASSGRACIRRGAGRRLEAAGGQAHPLMQGRTGRRSAPAQRTRGSIFRSARQSGALRRAAAFVF